MEPKEEAESQRATELDLPARRRRREVQFLQKDVVGLTQGLLVPGPEDMAVSSTFSQGIPDELTRPTGS